MVKHFGEHTFSEPSYKPGSLHTTSSGIEPEMGVNSGEGRPAAARELVVPEQRVRRPTAAPRGLLLVPHVRVLEGGGGVARDAVQRLDGRVVVGGRVLLRLLAPPHICNEVSRSENCFAFPALSTHIAASRRGPRWGAE